MKITKTPKRLAAAAPEVVALQDRITKSSDDELPAVLDSISEWCWPRGDLYYWTGVLNRFDTILENVCRDYDVSNIQVNHFTPLTKRLVVSLLRFSRLLIENCTNRKLYSSFEHLNQLLYTRDLDVLEATLRLVLRAAQQHNSHHPRHDFQISKERLTTLAMIWTPRDHGLSLVDVAQPENNMPSELSHVRFQFFRRSAPAANSASATSQPVASSSALSSTDSNRAARNAASPHQSQHFQHHNHATSTPTRSRNRDQRPAMLPALSAGALPATPTRTDDRSDAGAAAQSGSTSAAAGRREGLITVDLGKITDANADPADLLAKAVETYEIPPEERFELFQRIRLALGLQHEPARRQLLVCRLLAIASYGLVINESIANTQLFLYEPDLIQRIAALVDPVQKLDMAIQSSAFYALDSLGRYRTRMTVVLNSVNASVNHGIILSVLRNLIDDLRTHTPVSSDHFVDSVLSFIAFVATSSSASHTIVGAGLIPLLVDLVNIPNPDRYMVQRTVSRAIGLVDSLTYAVPQAFDLFCNARGLDVVVDRIKAEVDRDIEDGSADRMSDSVFGEPGPDNLYGRLAFGRASLLRAMFKSITQMMASTGTGDGLRNLVNTTLPNSLKRIILNRSIFGPQILALAILITSTFVHNEPTSLAILQEAKIPEVLFDAIEADIEAHWDVIYAIPNAIGAICLNQAGLDLFNSRPLIPKLFSLFTSERHSKVFQDRDNANAFGAAIDELMRHQPSLKTLVMDSIMRSLDEIHQMGRDFELPQDAKARAAYGLLPVGDAAADQAAAAAADGSASGRAVALADVVTDEPDPIRKEDITKLESNPVIASIDVVARFLEGLFQTTSHCKDFIKMDGFDKLLGFYSLPCLPYDFSVSLLADSLVTLVRLMAEISPSTVLIAMLRDVKAASEEVAALFGVPDKSFASLTYDNTVSRLLWMAAPRDDAEAERANLAFRKLVGLCSRTHLFTDVCTITYVGHKLPSIFLQTLVASSTSGTISLEELGAIHRACAWENMLLKTSLPPPPPSTGGAGKPDAEAKPADPAQTASQQPASSATPDPSGAANANAAAGSSTQSTQVQRTPQHGVPDDLLQDLAGTVEQRAQSAGSGQPQEEDPRQRNAAALRYVASQIPSSLTSLFEETVRYLAPRRSVDAAHKAAAYMASVEIAKFLKEHLTWRESSNGINSFAFAMLMICQTSCLLFDERPSSPAVYPAILRAWDKQGGLDALFDLFRRYVAEIDRFYNGHGNSIELSPTDIDEAGIKLGHTCGGLKATLGVLLKLVHCKGLTDSAQTTQLIRDGGKDVFEPHAYLVQIRLRVLQLLLSVWDKPWLPSLPASINRLMLQNLLTILKAQNESAPAPKKSTTASGASGAAGTLEATMPTLLNMRSPFAFGSAPRVIPPLVRRPPNEERVRTMVDMGFPENAARHALSRCQNNLNAATEYLLTHDDLVVHYRDNPNQPWNDDSTPGAAEAQNATRATAASTAQPANDASAAAAPGAPAAAAANDDADEWEDQDDNAPVRDESNAASGGVPDAPMADAGASSGSSAQVSDKPSETDDTMDAVKVAATKADLDRFRTDLRASLVERGLELADHHPALVFEVKSAILLQASERAQAMARIEMLVQVIDSEASAAFGAKADFIALRMQLLALVLHDEQIFKQLDRDVATSVLRSLEALIQLYGSRSSTTPEASGTAQHPSTSATQPAKSSSTPPKWLASLILALVGILGFSEDIAEVKPDDALLDAPVEADTVASSAPEQTSDKSAEAAVDSTTSTTTTTTAEKPILPRVRVGSVPISDALFHFALQIFREATTLERNDLLAAFRLLTVLTRNHSYAARFAREGGVRLILEPFRVLEPKQVSGCQPFVAMVLRHIVEDAQTLATVMSQEIHSLVAQSRNKTSDTSTLIRQLDCAILRDPDAFLESAVAKVEMTEYSPTKGSGHIKLIQDPSATETTASKESPSDLADNGQASLASLRLGDDPMESTADGANGKTADEPAFFKAATQSSAVHAPSEELDALMGYLLTELLKSTARKPQSTSGAQTGTAANANASGANQDVAQVEAGGAGSDASNGAPAAAGSTASPGQPQEKTEEEKQDDIAFFYSSFLMQCLTELLSSYASCKTSFVNYNKKRLFAAAIGASATPVSTPAASASAGVAFAPGTPGGKDAARSRAGILSTFLTELVPAGFLSSFESSELRRKMTLSNWAMSVLVALSADVSVHSDVKEVPADLISVRKTVLDAIARAIKEAASSSEAIEVRYGRLYALSDLCYRLLIARPNSPGGKQTEDLTLHMAKTMLEKNFVTVLTSAIADVDLNLPTVKSLLEAILRPLEHLTKVAIRMGKAKDKNTSRAVIDESEDDTEFSSDYDMDEAFDDDDDDDHDIGREDTPDFYRNSSLGMHTGEMETGLDDDEMTDEDMDDDEDMEMEDFDSETGSELSTDEELEGLDGDDPHVMEITDSDTDMDDSSDSDSDSDSDDHTHSHGHGSHGDDVSIVDEEDEWTDEDDDEGDSDLDDDDEETLDFVFEDGEDGEDGMPAIPEEFDEGDDAALMDGDVGDGLMDDEEIEMLEEDSMDGGMDQDDLSQLELAEEYVAPVDDRFGANWGWTNATDPRMAGSGDRPRSSGLLPPNFFLPNAIANMASGTGGHRRRNLLDFDSMMAPRRMAPPSDEISTHPLLVDQSDADANRHAGRGGRNGVGGGLLPSGYADWAQSVEDFVGEGALQFLENLLTRGGASNQGIRIELGDGGRMRIDSIDVSGRPGRAGHHHHHHHHPHSHTQHGQAVLGGDGQRALTSRQAAAMNDPVVLAQSFTPSTTLARWSEEALILLPSATVSSECTSKVRAHLINALLPGFKKNRLETRRQLEEDRKALEQAKKTREQAEAELKRLREGKERTEKELEEARERLRQGEERARQMLADGDAAFQTPAAESSSSAAPLAAAQAGEHQTAASVAEANAPAVPTAANAAGSEPTQSSVASAAVADDVEMADAESAPTGSAATQPAEASSSAAASTQAQTSAEAARTTISINGEEIDISDTGIDPTFLEALPDDLREEVLNQHFRERRAAEATNNLPQPTSIAPEFLDALPPELRAEVIQQEALEASRRRIREQMASRGTGDRPDQGSAQTAREGAAPAATSDAAGADGAGSADRRNDYLDSIEEILRDGPGGVPDPMAIAFLHNEHGDGRNRQHRRFDEEEDSQDVSSGTVRAVPASTSARLGAMPIRMLNASGGARPGGTDTREVAPIQPSRGGPQRDAIQLLDKSGLATLVRLLFFPQMNAKQTNLHKVLANLCENAKTRSELLNLLLMVLSEGSVDAHAVDRSFVSMSNRANRMHSTPSRPTPKRANTGPASAVQPQQSGQVSAGSTAPLSKTGDEAPFLIASRSIETLLHLTSVNEEAAMWFLRNDARPPKRAKGKEKETDASERGSAPINVLLGLLSKETILVNSQLVDSLLALISTATKPLLWIARNKTGDANAKATTSAPSASNEAATSTEMVRSDGPNASTSEQPSSGAAGAAATSSTTVGGAAPGETPSAAKSAQPGADERENTIPDIPAERLRNLVKPLATAISSKGFQNTLAIAWHVDLLEDARATICGALREQANQASRSLVGDLDALLSTLPEPVEEAGADKKAGGEASGEGDLTPGAAASASAAAASVGVTQSGIVISGPTVTDRLSAMSGAQRIESKALATLASPANAQAVLLRSLRALNYIMTGR
ncbi:related to E3 ubiquitin protein ligase TOM1 [Sporisorium reilianum SRZ2]|uniref:Related to E3 ubiquitin protein ligase TOM1 n=1 Tax=Sporisorium reilianum (strain SRZ2) TaxID=999809 RepID=E6ZRX2_SPORE|nr:related to E3 ubiquitin protein ligase TOM1 [Sporisorium reilianum SRZ2]